jgi:hypothetical protein
MVTFSLLDTKEGIILPFVTTNILCFQAGFVVHEVFS